MKTRDVLTCKCDPQTQYECGGLGMSTCEYAGVVSMASVALCESRHNIPGAIDGSIFPQSVDPTDVVGLEREAERIISESGVQYLNVYVTGLTVALVAVINACQKLGVKLMLMHYDRETGTYFPQFVRR